MIVNCLYTTEETDMYTTFQNQENQVNNRVRDRIAYSISKSNHTLKLEDVTSS